MFNSATYGSSGQQSRQLASTYARVGVETSVATASPHKLVTLLFDGFADALVLARAGLRDGNIEQKCLALNRATRIIDEGLKAGLNLREGGPLADNLQALYSYVSMRLVYANLHNDLAALEECQRLIEPLREAWAAIRPQVETVPA